MALATFVKINSVNNLSDARYCAGMEVDQMGFVIEEGQLGFVSPEDFKEIADWLSGVDFVGEISSNQSNISALIEHYPLQAIQVSDQEQIAPALATGLQVIFLSEKVSEAQAVLSQYPELAYVLLTDKNLNDLDQIKDLEKIVLTHGFEAENVKAFVDERPIKGIAMSGGDEIRPGFKDFDELADILEALDTDEFV
jgi:phosphoribosylanthranilate isomerase